MRDAQIVVIGSGPGGAVTATMLAEAGMDVLLLEEGQHLPLESAPHFSREEILQKYRNAGVNVTMGAMKVAWVEGSCVGGGSEVNRGIYKRLPADVFDSWRQKYQVAGLSEEELAAHYDAIEQMVKVSYLPGEAPLVSLKLKEGSTNLGWECVESPRLVSYSKDPRSGPVGVKQSMTTTFIPRFLAAGGRLQAETRVHRLSRRNGRWVLMVEVGPRDRRSSAEIGADNVFVACGAVQTPTLLRRSGFKHNIGDTLRYHSMVKAVALFKEEINEPSDLEPVHQVKEFDPRFSIGCSVSKRPALALALADRPEHLHEVDESWRRMAIYYAQSTGGRARVRAVPGFRDPLVLAERNSQDMIDLAEGLKRLAECMFAAGAEAVYPSMPGLPILRSVADIERLPDQLSPPSGGITTMHVFSSCPMGENRALCATDSHGKVYGTDGLYISDASLLCGPTVVNPQATVMAVAHRNALHFLDANGHRARMSTPTLKEEAFG